MSTQDDPNFIEKLVNRFFTDFETRHYCLAHLAESIRLANHWGPDRWSVTVPEPERDKIRLNVGMIETMMFEDGWVRLILDAETIPDELKEHASQPGYYMSASGKYSSVPSSVLYNFPAESAGIEIGLARSSHRVLIEKAARTSRNPTIVKAYSPGVTEYVANFLGISLAHPTFYKGSESSGGEPPPRRSTSTVERLVRKTAITDEVKQLHDYCCQVCGLCLNTPAGSYAEGAHIRPLGSPHDGPDLLENVLCLCPNHHVLLDYGAISIQDDLTLIGMEGKLRTAPGHQPSPTYLRYHREMILDKG